MNHWNWTTYSLRFHVRQICVCMYTHQHQIPQNRGWDRATEATCPAVCRFDRFWPLNSLSAVRSPLCKKVEPISSHCARSGRVPAPRVQLQLLLNKLWILSPINEFIPTSNHTHHTINNMTTYLVCVQLPYQIELAQALPEFSCHSLTFGCL